MSERHVLVSTRSDYGTTARGSAGGTEWTRASSGGQPALDSHTRRYDAPATGVCVRIRLPLSYGGGPPHARSRIALLVADQGASRTATIASAAMAGGCQADRGCAAAGHDTWFGGHSGKPMLQRRTPTWPSRWAATPPYRATSGDTGQRVIKVVMCGVGDGCERLQAQGDEDDRHHDEKKRNALPHLVESGGVA